MNRNLGLRMDPLLICNSFSCGWSKPVRGPAKNLPDVDAALKCPECGEVALLATYGIVNDRPTLSDLREFGLRQAQGTWWR